MTLIADSPVSKPLEVEQPVAVTSVVIKTKKVRAPKHDFKDGNGRVFAHKHIYGGGWVADSAKVADTVYVGRNCEIYNGAVVAGDTRLTGHAKIYGVADVYGKVKISQMAHVYGRAMIRDDVTLNDSCRVGGAAVVSGTSRLFGNSTVAESAHIISCTLSDNSSVAGGAVAVRCHFSGRARVRGNSTLTNATVGGFVHVRDFAQIINSRVHNNHAEIETLVADHVAVLNNTGIYFPVTLRNHVTIIHSHLARYDNNAGAAPLEIRDNTIISHVTFNNRTEMDAYLSQVARRNGVYQPAAQQNVAPNAINPVSRTNYLEQPRGNRRLMALQETTT